MSPDHRPSSATPPTTAPSANETGGDGAGRYAAAGELLRALSAPVRIAIVVELAEHGQCVHELVGRLGLPQPLVSQHLRVLKSAGVVRGTRSGREIMYRLVDDHLVHIVTDAITHSGEASVTTRPADTQAADAADGETAATVRR